MTELGCWVGGGGPCQHTRGAYQQGAPQRVAVQDRQGRLRPVQVQAGSNDGGSGCTELREWGERGREERAESGGGEDTLKTFLGHVYVFLLLMLS